MQDSERSLLSEGRELPPGDGIGRKEGFVVAYFCEELLDGSWEAVVVMAGEQRRERRRRSHGQFGMRGRTKLDF